MHFMMKSSEEIIIEYIRSIKNKYPEYTEQQLIAVCKAPFKVIASEMKNRTLRDIRVKYLGTFCVFPGRAKGILKQTKKLFEQGKLTKEFYEDVLLITDKYLKDHEKRTLD